MSGDLIETTAPLKPGYSPETVIDRSDEREAIAAALAPDAHTLPNLYIHGPRGTGKTLVTTDYLTELPDEVHTIYVPCTVYDTQYKVLKRLYHALTGDRAQDGHHTAELQRAIEERTSAVPTVIVLDDVEFLLHNDGNDLLYFVSRVDHANTLSTVLISACEKPIQARIEERTYSSLYPQAIEFEPYYADTTAEILTARAAAAFDAESLHETARRYIVSSTQNVTFALKWLEAAAKRSDTLVTEDAVVDTYDTAHEDYIRHTLDDFTDHHQHLYETIRSLADVDEAVHSGDVYDAYQQRCRCTALSPRSKRSVSDYLKHLELLGLIDADYHYGGEKGKTRELRLRKDI